MLILSTLVCMLRKIQAKSIIKLVTASHMVLALLTQVSIACSPLVCNSSKNVSAELVF